MSRNVVLTGGNRGIGLELAKHYQTIGDRVTVLCRQPSESLEQLKVHVIDNVDVTNDVHILEASHYFKQRTIDILINNAGIFELETIDNLNLKSINQQWLTNALGPVSIVKHLLPCLTQGAKIALISSQMGSIDDNSSGGYYGYRMSKAALNAAGKSLAIDLKPKGISVALLHPGFVRTQMTGHQGNIEASESAAGLVKQIDNLNLNNSGSFWNYKGEILSW